MTRLFVVLSGLPASGKTTLGRRLAPALGLPLFDKDDILSPLLAALEVSDPVTRHRLSRGADSVLHQLAAGSAGAVISSFWRRPQLSETSGTPTDWLESLADSAVVEVFCQCPPQLAARRFSERGRHPGHGDTAKNTTDLIERFTAWTALGPLRTGRAVVTVDSSQPVDARSVAAGVRELSRL